MDDKNIIAQQQLGDGLGSANNSQLLYYFDTSLLGQCVVVQPTTE